MKKLTELTEWQALNQHHQLMKNFHMLDGFAENPARFEQFSIKNAGILLDYSKNRITHESLTLLNNLANARDLKSKIEKLFTGGALNHTEHRAALHTALRDYQNPTLTLKNRNIMVDIRETLNKMRQFTDQIQQKTWRGVTNKPITDIVNIGIGGSHLGPRMAIHALADYAAKDLRCHFISNIDSAHIHAVLEKIDPESTLFIVSSKSFTTLETITNAATIRTWLENKLNTTNLASHLIAVTASIEAALQFGIPEKNIFPLWDWVGGRYSIWSAIGLPIAILIGMDNFLEFLAGAHEMDVHFKEADFRNNMPVILALLGIWYINFFHTRHHAIIPYSHHLNYLRVYLQQLEMESNGKYIAEEGHEVDFHTCPVIFGEQGCNGQHAFHQLLHQGPHLIPVDFILVAQDKKGFAKHQNILIGSGLSQAAALMQGKSYLDAFNELKSLGISDEASDILAKHKMVPGNRPSNILLMDEVTPKNLGALVALYEHKTFVQGVIWKINSFDQWGVELGKTLLSTILEDLTSHRSSGTSNDASTNGLIEYFKNIRKNP